MPFQSKCLNSLSWRCFPVTFWQTSASSGKFVAPVLLPSSQHTSAVKLFYLRSTYNAEYTFRIM